MSYRCNNLDAFEVVLAEVVEVVIQGNASIAVHIHTHKVGLVILAGGVAHGEEALVAAARVFHFRFHKKNPRSIHYI